MSNLWLPKPDFIKPATKRVDIKHPLAWGLRLAVILNGLDCYEAVHGVKGARYKGPDVWPSHMRPAMELHDVDTTGRTSYPGLPHGQNVGMIGAQSAANRIEFDLHNELATFIEFNKPWSYWILARTHAAYGGELMSWGVGSTATLRGFNLQMMLNATAPYNGAYVTHIISNWAAGNAKRFDTGQVSPPMNHASILFTYNGKPSGPEGNTEVKMYIGKYPVYLGNYPNGGSQSASIIPEVKTPLMFYTRGDGSNTGWGETHFALFWDRVLGPEDVKMLDLGGMPFLV